MTSNKEHFYESYHPIQNPKGNKKNRQALSSEGFSKDCILKINDTKYISAGRIEKETVKISNELLEEIQKQVFQVQFPNLFTKHLSHQKTIQKNERLILEQKEEIIRLKQENNRLNQILKNHEKH